MTKEEGNKIIAIFDGAIVKYDDKDFHYYEHLIPYKNTKGLEGQYAGRCHGLTYAVKDVESNDFLEVNSLKYHLSWDWLMPVLEKIHKLDHIRIDMSIQLPEDSYGTHCWISGYGESHIRLPHFHSNNCETLLEAVYKAITQFIQWYNNNKNT